MFCQSNVPMLELTENDILSNRDIPRALMLNWANGKMERP